MRFGGNEKKEKAGRISRETLDERKTRTTKTKPDDGARRGINTGRFDVPCGGGGGEGQDKQDGTNRERTAKENKNGGGRKKKEKEKPSGDLRMKTEKSVRCVRAVYDNAGPAAHGGSS